MIQPQVRQIRVHMHNQPKDSQCLLCMYICRTAMLKVLSTARPNAMLVTPAPGMDLHLDLVVR